MPDTAQRMGWEEIETLAARLARGLDGGTASGDWDRVVGVARGGLVPAVLVASRLGVKRLETVQVRLYDGTCRLDRPEVVGEVPRQAGPSGDPTRTLIVDEMVDSGTTLAYLQTRYPQATCAALVARRPGPPVGERQGLLGVGVEGAPAPVWVVQGLETDRWILFPWSPPEDRVACGEAP